MKSHREVILEELQKMFTTQEALDYFLSTPNKVFHNKSPVDCLNQGVYYIFYDLLDFESNKLLGLV